MKKLLLTAALLGGLALPAFCQSGRLIASSAKGYQDRDRDGRDRDSRYQQRLSPEDQREFDKAYSKWVNDRRKNDRDDVERDARRMQDIMARNNIPADVPFDEVASSGYAQNGEYDNGRYDNGQDRDRDRDRDRYDNRDERYSNQARLSPEDQREFDKAYSKWVNDSRKNDRDDIKRDVRKMQDIMARYNIPSDVPYDQIASPDAAGYRH